MQGFVTTAFWMQRVGITARVGFFSAHPALTRAINKASVAGLIRIEREGRNDTANCFTFLSFRSQSRKVVINDSLIDGRATQYSLEFGPFRPSD